MYSDILSLDPITLLRLKKGRVRACEMGDELIAVSGRVARGGESAEPEDDDRARQRPFARDKHGSLGTPSASASTRRGSPCRQRSPRGIRRGMRRMR